jgi:uncharacterized protein YcbK (DUF882 family)
MSPVLSRRRVLAGSGAFFIAGSAGRALATPLESVRKIAFDCLHTGEKLAVEYWDSGRYLPDAMTAVNRALRDFRTGDIHPIAPGLLDLLSRLHEKLGSHEPFQVISGYRSPRTNAMLHEHSSGVASRSLHMQGMAIDIRLAGTALSNLRGAALALKAGGVGYYPSSDFVHVDVGRVRRW